MIKEMNSLGYDTSKKTPNSKNKKVVNKNVTQNKQQPKNNKFTYDDMLKEMNSLGYNVPKVKINNTVKPTNTNIKFFNIAILISIFSTLCSKFFSPIV